ncbi:Ubiquitin-like protein [Rhodosporidiobolus nylandii]
MSTFSPIPSPALGTALSPASTPSAFLPSPASAGTAASTPREALEAYKTAAPATAKVRFKATGNAPIMKQNFYKIAASHRFDRVISFLRKELGWKASEALFLYINSSFSPAPDDTVANLYRCFGTEGQLIVNYSSTQAWG